MMLLECSTFWCTRLGTGVLLRTKNGEIFHTGESIMSEPLSQHQENAERLETVLAWIEDHADEAIADLQYFCRQPSISAQNKGMREMAELVARHLREMGAETSQVPTAGYPVVVGRLNGESARRLAFYDHY